MSEIKKIILDVDGKEIKLTQEQARDLRDLLLELWPERQAAPVWDPIIVERWRDRPRPYWGRGWTSPYTYPDTMPTYPTPSWHPPGWMPMCSGNTMSLTATSNTS